MIDIPIRYDASFEADVDGYLGDLEVDNDLPIGFSGRVAGVLDPGLHNPEGIGPRLAACWNACLGIPTDALSGGLVPRAQLDAALTLVRRMADVWEPEGSGVSAALDRMHALRADARALLAGADAQHAGEGADAK